MLMASPKDMQAQWNTIVATTLDYLPGVGDLLRGWPGGAGMPARMRAAHHRPGSAKVPPLADGCRDAPVPLPAGARFVTRSFLSPWGARDYRLYIPAALPDGPRGLMVMLHGCTQNADDFARGTGMNRVADRHGLLVAYPNQARAYNPKACWNWFRPGDQRRSRGEPALLAGLARALRAEFGLDPNAVFAAGLSAGGAMAAVLGATHPDVFAAVGIHSGLAHGAAHDAASAFAAMRGEAGPARPSVRRRPVRTIVFHGSADSVVHPANAASIIRAATPGSPQARQTIEHGVRCRRRYRRTILGRRDGPARSEFWLLDGAGHAWSGGTPEGSHTDPLGPDASAEMVRFFLEGHASGAR